MNLNIDYNNCITNLSCSILKYFGLEYKHNTIKEIDDALKSNPKNVVVILCDGMGHNILNRVLNKNDFLVKNEKRYITSIFPSTTAASTTSIMTGLNPYEHCWLGWDIYMKSVDEVVTMFYGKIKDSDVVIDKDLCYKEMGYKTIMDRINELDNSNASYISSFTADQFDTIDEMCEKIKNSCNIKDKNYIYAYYKNPDELMHIYGSDSDESIKNIKELNKKIEELCNELDDTVVIVTADHGHINSDFIYLEDYPEIFNMLVRNTSIDSRASMMFVKNEYKNIFKEKFLEMFKDNFLLLDKDEIYKYNLFGIGDKHDVFDSAIGDFIAIGTKNLNIKYKRVPGKIPFKSSHAGITLDEVLIPLIIYNK